MKIIRQEGFTLIEMMVVVVILGMLVSLSWNGYQQHVTRAYRAQGRAAILQVLLEQERHHAGNRSYRTYEAIASETEFRWFSGEQQHNSAYLLHATACPDHDLHTCVRVSAVPRADRFIDDGCGTLSADTLGRRSASGNANCW